MQRPLNYLAFLVKNCSRIISSTKRFGFVSVFFLLISEAKYKIIKTWDQGQKYIYIFAFRTGQSLEITLKRIERKGNYCSSVFKGVARLLLQEWKPTSSGSAFATRHIIFYKPTKRDFTIRKHSPINITLARYGRHV